MPTREEDGAPAADALVGIGDRERDLGDEAIELGIRRSSSVDRSRPHL